MTDAEPAGETVARQPIEVLLVEDNPADVRMIREALAVSRMPHVLHVVEDGEEALEFVHRRGRYAAAPTPGVMLLDLNIPRLSGHEVMALMRADPSLPRFPIVVLTGSKLEKDMEESFALNAAEYIVKPTRLFEYVGGLAFALGLAKRKPT